MSIETKNQRTTESFQPASGAGIPIACPVPLTHHATTFRVNPAAGSTCPSKSRISSMYTRWPKLIFALSMASLILISIFILGPRTMVNIEKLWIVSGLLLPCSVKPWKLFKNKMTGGMGILATERFDRCL